MLSVLLCVLASGSLLLILRLAKAAKITLLPMIVTNYITCVTCGFFFVPDYFSQIETLSNKLPLVIGWFHGVLFVSLFFLIGKASQQIGVAYTAMITRVSVLFPTLLSILVYQETMNGWGWLGIILTLVAIILLHWKYISGATLVERKGAKRLFILSAILFLGTGLADAIFKVIDFHFGKQINDHLYTLTVFQSAALMGTLVVLLRFMQNRLQFKLKDFLWGILLGVPNYFSVVFLFWALEVLPGPVFFPINHIGVLIFVSLVGIFYFKERFSTASWLGFGVACLSILLMANQELIQLFR
jgi:drug/metabolite transporter (DMT)-like permease